MTHEESLMMWKLEKDSFDKNEAMASKDMKKLYKILDKAIVANVVTYEDFTNDMIEELMSITKDENSKDRAFEVDEVCRRLTKKYETKYNERESGSGNRELSADNTEVSDTKELHESECVSKECNDNSSEIA